MCADQTFEDAVEPGVDPYGGHVVFPRTYDTKSFLAGRRTGMALGERWVLGERARWHDRERHFIEETAWLQEQLRRTQETSDGYRDALRWIANGQTDPARYASAVLGDV